MIVQIQVTCPTKPLAQEVAQTLVQEKLAACVQLIGPITSIYSWKGQIEQEEEWLCLIKSMPEHFKRIEARIKELHPYEVPEIISTSISHGSEAYLNWVKHYTS